jgi:phosphoribosylanthranilate isomerase
VISVKICGITNARDAEMCVSAGARAIGFVFYGLSPRAVSPATAREIGRLLPKSVRKVGVFVNSRADIVEDIADRAMLDMVQLSGEEAPEEVAKIKRCKVIKAFRPKTVRDLEKILRYPTIAAALIDSGSSESAYGGSGVLVDFAIAREAKKYAKSMILAGGLNGATITRAVREVQPPAVDVCSGVESEPGKKDPKKVKGLFEALWRLDEESRIAGSGIFRSLGGIVKALDPPKPKEMAAAPEEPPSDLLDEIR